MYRILLSKTSFCGEHLHAKTLVRRKAEKLFLMNAYFLKMYLFFSLSSYSFTSAQTNSFAAAWLLLRRYYKLILNTIRVT